MNPALRLSAVLTIPAMLAVSVHTAAEESGATAPAEPLRSLRDYVESVQGRQPYGIYFGTKKLGWMVEEIGLGTHEGREAVIHTEEARIQARVFGVDSSMEMRSRTVYGLDGDGEILHARERLVEDDSVSEITVTRDGDEVVIATESAGQTTTRRSPLPRETLRRMWELDRWLQSGPKAGDTFEDYSTEWSEPDIDVKELYTFKEKKTIVWGGVPTEVYTVQIRIQGVEAEAMVTNAGWIIKGKMAGLFDIRAEEEAVARNLEGEAIDLLAATSLTLDKPLGDPEQVRALTLKLSGLGDFKLPLSHRQRLRSGEDGAVVLEMLRDYRIEEPRTLSDAERKKHLSATPALPTEHPKIRDLATKIVEGEQNTVERARRIAEWIHENLRPTYAANASNAFQVLENRSGDCSEYTILFVALARSAGIPTREVAGLIYTGDETGMVWHAWAEVHDGTQWVSVDPMWDQVYVDATHITFSEAVEDWSWVNVIGRLKIEVIDFKTR